MLERVAALGSLLEGTDDRLVITGLGSAANDMSYLTDTHPRVFAMDGVMGAATSIGLGLALAQPRREVLVVTGDGELLMNIGSLVTVAMQSPVNLTIVVVDNGRYGLTGDQITATDSVTDLEAMAKGAGIARTVTARTDDDVAAARELVHAPGTSLVVLKVRPGPAAAVQLERDGVLLRSRFRTHVIATTQKEEGDA